MFKGLHIIFILLLLALNINTLKAIDKPVNTRIITVEKSVNPFFGIQILTLRDGITDSTFFNDLESVREFSCSDGYKRYVVGQYKTYEEARENIARIRSLNSKYEGAFVINTANYVLQDIGAKQVIIPITTPSPKPISTGNQETISKTEINKKQTPIEKSTASYYGIQVSALKGGSNESITFNDIEESVKEFLCKDGFTRFVAGSYKSVEEARTHLTKIRSTNSRYKGAFIVNTANFEFPDLVTKDVPKNTINTIAKPATNPTAKTVTNTSASNKTTTIVESKPILNTPTTTSTDPKPITNADTKPIRKNDIEANKKRPSKLSIDRNINSVVIEGCDISAAPLAVNTQAALELLGVKLTNECTPNLFTPDVTLVITSTDVTTGKNPLTINRTYTIKNVCGDLTTKTQLITIEDNVSPIITGTIKTVNLAGCSAKDIPVPLKTVAELSRLGITVSDNCDLNSNLLVSSSDVTAVVNSSLAITRTYTVKDASGNEAKIPQTFIIDDKENPIITGSLKALNVQGCNDMNVPPSLTTVAELEALGVSISDKCTPDANLLVSSSDGSSLGECPKYIIRTYVIKDPSGNSSTTNQTINITDDTNPIITGTIKEASFSGCSEKDAPSPVTTIAQLETLGVTVSDNCASKIDLGITSSDEFSVGKIPKTITRTYTVIDACGNVATTPQTIILNDKKAPVISGTIKAQNLSDSPGKNTPPAVKTIAQLEALGISVSDDCTPNTDLVLSNIDEAPLGICPKTITRTYTVKDASSNSAKVLQTFIIDDSENPVITGTLKEINVDGCNVKNLPLAVKTIAELEALGVSVSDNSTTDMNLVLSSTDGSPLGECPKYIIRTYIIKDACGNSSTINQTINITDNIKPIITGIFKPIELIGCSEKDAPAAVKTIAEAEVLGVKISDNCTPNTNLILSSSDEALAGKSLITITRTYTVKDDCGNTATIPQTITLNDKVNPVISGSIKATSFVGSSDKESPTAVTTITELEALGVKVSDNCTPNTSLILSFNDEAPIGKCPKTITRTYTIKDSNGNEAKVPHTITINDSENPVIIGTLKGFNVDGCNANDFPATVSTIAELETLGVNVSDNFTADANLILTSSDALPSETNPSYIIRTYVVKDACGNSSSTNQTINISDKINPIITGTIKAVDLVGCLDKDAITPVKTIAELEVLGAKVSDNCTPDENLVLSSVDEASVGKSPKTLIRTYTVKDASGNSATIPQTITLNDKVNPVITGTIKALNLDGCSNKDTQVSVKTIAELEALGVVVSDNCTPDENLVLSFSDAPLGGTCPMTFIRTYTIKDASGNIVTASQMINVFDNTSPVITDTLKALHLGACLTNELPGAVKTIAELERLGVSVSDNCSPDSSLVLTSSDASLSGSCPMTFIRTYSVKDICGNVATIPQTIIINDKDNPVVNGTIKAVTLFGCSDNDVPSAIKTIVDLEKFGVSVIDNCTPKANLVLSSSDVTSTTKNPLTITRTYSIKDACGNITSIPQTITLKDKENPVVTGAIKAIDMDGCLSEKDIPFAVKTISELEALGVKISDNCTPNLSLELSSSEAALEGSSPKRIIRTYTIKDAAGNIVATSQSIIIKDKESPVITDTIKDINLDGCLSKNDPIPAKTIAELEALGVTVSDNCTPKTSLVITSSDASPLGTCPITTIRTYTVKDVSGNSATKTQRIIKGDRINPVITGSIKTIDLVGCNEKDVPVAVKTITELEALGVTVSDNCTPKSDLVLTSTEEASVGKSPMTITRTYTVKDACGNTSSTKQAINITDKVNPVITGNIKAVDLEGCSEKDKPTAVNTVSELRNLGVTVSDNCTSNEKLVISSTDATLAGTCPVKLIRTYTIKDAAGNSATTSQTITFKDKVNPVIADTIQSLYLEGCPTKHLPPAVKTISELEALGVDVSDNCAPDANLVLSSTDTEPIGACPITIIRIYTVKDACGNSALKTQRIIKNDNVKPVITGELNAINVSGCSEGNIPTPIKTVAELERLGVSISDNCTSDGNLVISSSDGTPVGKYPTTITRTYTLKDACGNEASINQSITVNDKENPVVVGTIKPVLLNACSGNDGLTTAKTIAELEKLGISISDNCTPDSSLILTSSDVLSEKKNPVTITRTYTVKDACGNITLIPQTITINDNVKPVITGTNKTLDILGCSDKDTPPAVKTIAELEAFGVSISDKCTPDADLVVSSSDASPAGTCPITIYRTYKVQDASGNTATTIQKIVKNDNVKPVITGVIKAVNISGFNEKDVPAPIITIAELEKLGIKVSDNCTPNTSLVLSSNDVPSVGKNPITVIRTYTVKDICGNAATIPQTFTITDKDNPVITGTMKEIELDGCLDNATQPAAKTIAELEALGVSVSDKSTSKANLVLSSSDATPVGTCPKTIIRTYTVKDGSGNSGKITQTITIKEKVNPVITGTIKDAVMYGCSDKEIPTAVKTITELEALGVAVSDNCTPKTNLELSSFDAVPVGKCPKTIVRTYTVKDACGNTTIKTQRIIRNDTIKPVITGSLNGVDVLDCSKSAVPLPVKTIDELKALGVTVLDNCTAESDLVLSSTDVASVGKYPITVTRTYTVKDDCGKGATISQIITISDKENPIISGEIKPIDVAGCSVKALPTPAKTIAELEKLGVKVSDNCTPNLGLNLSSSDAAPMGKCPMIIIRTYTVKDPSGNTAKVSQIFNINDKTNPEIKGTLIPINFTDCKSEIPVAVNKVSALESFGLTVTDACTSDENIVVNSSDLKVGTCPLKVTRTYKLTDECLNTSTAVQIITMINRNVMSISAIDSLDLNKREKLAATPIKTYDPNTIYTIQVTASHYPFLTSDLKEFDQIFEFYMPLDKVYRYTVGMYKGNDVKVELARVLSLGYKEAFVVKWEKYLSYRIE